MFLIIVKCFFIFLRNIYRLHSDTALLSYKSFCFASNFFIISYRYFGFPANASTFTQILLLILFSCKYFSSRSNNFSFFQVFLVLTACSYHVTDAFQSESTLYSWLNVKELLAQSRGDIWSSSDCNMTRTHNHLVRKRTLNHWANWAKWLSVCLRTKWLCFRVL